MDFVHEREREIFPYDHSEGFFVCCRYFQQFGSIFRAMHIFNPFTGEKKGYGFVDFVDFNVVKRCTHGGSNSKMFQIHGQQAWYGKFLPRNIKVRLSISYDTPINDSDNDNRETLCTWRTVWGTCY